MNKQVNELKFGSEVRESILRGVELIEKAVSVTLGPAGRNVAIETPYGSPKITKDGVTVSLSIVSVPDKFEDMGIQMLKEASNKSGQIAGDGTTTTVVLAAAIYREGLKHVTAGCNPIELKRGIDKAVRLIVEELKEMSQVVSTNKEIEQVGTISANGDNEIGKIIAEAMDRTGVNGTIVVENGQGFDTTLTIVEGMEVVSPYMSPYFATNPQTLEAELDEPFILLLGSKITNVQEILPLLQGVSQSGKPLVIMCDDIDTDALSVLVTNKLRGTVNVCAVKSPSYGANRNDIMEDIAIMTGGTYISNDLGISPENIEPEHLGTCKRIVVTMDRCTIIEGKGDKDKINERIETIRNQIITAPSKMVRQYELRLAKLDGGIGIIHVGALTESEMAEKKDRVDDAVMATKAAICEGIVAGGGVALIRCIEQLDDVDTIGDEFNGVEIVRKSLESPLRTLLFNAGSESGLIIETIKASIKAGDPDLGYDVKNGEYADLIKIGVIDPTKVTRSAIQNAGSIAGMLLTMEVAVGTIPDLNPPSQETEQMVI